MECGPVFLAASILAGPTCAAPPSLAPPLDCNLGAACFVQQYVDTDPGPDALDFTCGPLSYDGHRGTDFALPSIAMMDAGVDVRATTPGTVRAVRDGMPDISVTTGAAYEQGKDCGNGVILDHADDWSTQYCHLKDGSVAVAPGDDVVAGDPLGQVGLSGRTTFPHLHLTLRHEDRIVDPFNPQGNPCGETARTLWRDPIPYRPGGIIEAGFADAIPGYDNVKAGTASSAGLSTDADTIVFWIYAFGGQADDELSIAIEGPDGPILRRDLTLARMQAQFFRALGWHRPRDGWPVGEIQAIATLTRQGARIDEIRRTIVLD